MCGICGSFGNNTAKDIGEAMVLTLKQRGPDSFGTFFEKDVFLGHSRLAIIDLNPEANQPLHSTCRRYSIVFNGEIYNYLDLRESLISSGSRFNSSSDTEVILEGYKQHGAQFFERLNGIFALAIWDIYSQELIVARDRFGVKPLYYSDSENVFTFGSEVKSILPKLSNASLKINKQAFTEFLKYGNVLGSSTLYSGIKEFQPGSYMRISKNRRSQKLFWNITDIKEIVISEEEAISQTRFFLESAVKRQLVADVPVGVFLSGGIDSTMITAYGSKHYKGKLNTYTAAFDFDKGVNELKRAAEISKVYGTNHHELFIKGGELKDVVQELVRIHDSPFSDAANIPLYLMTKSLDGQAKVILQGDGGDELFAGYRRYRMLNRLRKRHSNHAFRFVKSLLSGGTILNARQKRIIHIFSNSNDGDLMADLLTVNSNWNDILSIMTSWGENELQNYNPNQEYLVCNSKFSEKDIVQRMLWTDIEIILNKTFLEKVDKSTMANSIEVRVPFLDNKLSEFALSLPSSIKLKNGHQKYLLKESLRGVVPDSVLFGPKTGFGVPYENWIKGPLLELLQDSLNSSSFRELGVFNDVMINDMVKEHSTGKVNHGFLLWKLMNLGIWLNQNKISQFD